MPKELKYDKAAFRLSNGNYDDIKLEDLIDMCKQNREKYITEYKGNLYCYECHKPQLSLCKDQFLRAHPNSVHADNCSHVLQLVSYSALERCLTSASADSINRKLQGLVDLLLKKQITDTHPLAVRMQGENCTLNDVKRSEITKTDTKLKALPVKSLIAPFDDDDYGVLKLFYGNVLIKAKEKQWGDSDPSYSLGLYHPTKKYLIATLDFSKKVKDHLAFSIFDYDNSVSNIAFAATLKKENSANPNYKIQFFKKGRLTYSKYLILG
jgi:hypothetical protein